MLKVGGIGWLDAVRSVLLYLNHRHDFKISQSRVYPADIAQLWPARILDDKDVCTWGVMWSRLTNPTARFSSTYHALINLNYHIPRSVWNITGLTHSDRYVVCDEQCCRARRALISRRWRSFVFSGRVSVVRSTRKESWLWTKFLYKSSW